jgi:hypothetical protein
VLHTSRHCVNTSSALILKQLIHSSCASSAAALQFAASAATLRLQQQRYSTDTSYCYSLCAHTAQQETLGAASICGADGELVSPLLLAALAACQCGGILLDRLSPYAFEGGEGVPLTLHGSIGAGDTATVEVSIWINGFCNAVEQC